MKYELLVYPNSCKNIDQKYIVLWIIRRIFHNKIQVEFQFHIKVAVITLIQSGARKTGPRSRRSTWA